MYFLTVDFKNTEKKVNVNWKEWENDKDWEKRKKIQKLHILVPWIFASDVINSNQADKKKNPNKTTLYLKQCFIGDLILNL